MAVLSIAVLGINVCSLCVMDKDVAQVAQTLTNIETYTPSTETIATMHENKDKVATSVTSYW